MLKRYQILLPDWQAEHYKDVAERYDISFSEMIRMALCVDIMTAIKASHPEFKLDIDSKAIKDLMKKRKVTDVMPMDEFHKFLSKLYFEARKAIDYNRSKKVK